MHTYIKKQLIDRTAEKCNIDPKDASPVINALFTVMREMMTEVDRECRIEIRNFGVFEVKNTAAKPKARNPKHPEETIYIPPRRKTHFRPGKMLKSVLKKPIR